MEYKMRKHLNKIANKNKALNNERLCYLYTVEFSKDFLGVPFNVNVIEIMFNFGFLENAYGPICQIHADGKEQVLDLKLYPLYGNMPPAWVEAATKNLEELLNCQD